MALDLSRIPFVSLALATLLSVHGLRKKSLSPSGALTAFVVGFLMMGGGVRVFGVTLIVFYLVGSRATKYGKQRKAKLEDGYQEGGYRTGWQVLCNSAAAFVAAFAWNAVFAPGSVHAALARVIGLDVGQLLGVSRVVVYDASRRGWCPLDGGIAQGWSRVLTFAVLGHFACCLGDTLASELGILSRSQPRLITTLRSVPPGTNGGMSVGGTVASVAGGAIIGVAMGASLVLENATCAGQWSGVLLESVGWGMFAGGFGSLIDSLMGATIQRTRYSTERKVVLQDDSAADKETKVISGWNILTNNQVNLLSSVLCAGIVGLVA